MLSKQVTYGGDARQKMKNGVDTLANAVKVTLGPKGRNVILDRGYQAPVVTKDGVTVAKEIHLADRIENLGATLVKTVASKTAEQAGDGTTTATILAQAMVNEGMKHLAAGVNPQGMRRGMEKALAKLVEAIKNLSVPVKDNEHIRQIASISANDPTIGALIAEAMDKVGNEGVVTVEESKTVGVSVEVTQGLRYDKGLVSPYFATDEAKRETVYENPLILITDHKIESGATIEPLVRKLIEREEKRPLVIIADEIRNEGLSVMLMVSRIKRFYEMCGTKAPSFGDRRRDVMDDIAVLTGARFITQEQALKVENVGIEDLGTCRRIVITDKHTTIIDGGGDKEKVAARLTVIRKQLDDAVTEYDKEKQRERIAQLSGGIASVKVGAATESEMIEKKHRIEDAIAATKAAVEEGIVPGGGTAQVSIEKAVRNNPALERGDVEEEAGFRIVLDSLFYPITQIMENAGKGKKVGVVLEQIGIEGAVNGWGYDAAKDEMCDLVERGIIDPAKVTRCALENAVSAAIMILTTEAAITDVPKDEDKEKVKEE